MLLGSQRCCLGTNIIATLLWLWKIQSSWGWLPAHAPPWQQRIGSCAFPPHDFHRRLDLSTHQTTSTSIAAALTSIKDAPTYPSSPISYTFEDLTEILEGKGRAQACFDCYRLGVDPLWFYSKSDNDDDNNNLLEREEISGLLGAPDQGWTRQQIKAVMSTNKTKKTNNGLGYKTMNLLAQRFGSIERHVSRLSKVTTCVDGTTKLLLDLVKDQLQIETVIIPWDDRQKSTLCISSQVGCRQACTFCATGRMGKLRSLTADEILSQMYWASKTCRILDIYPIENVVFMGLGEPADNVEAVTRAAQNLVHPHVFQLAPRKVTISTVAPTPQAFEDLSKSEVVIAWSVHASQDSLRKQLVPTTQYTMAELRSGLIRTLQGRRKRLRNTMLEITLLDKVNDSKDDALHLAEFCRPILDEVDGIKLVVNLIPWNDIAATSGPAAEYRKPSMDRVLEFQKVLIDHGIMCYIRTTRGDEENAACGMLATKKPNRTLT